MLIIWATVSAAFSAITTGILTEGGDFLISESGEYLVQE